MYSIETTETFDKQFKKLDRSVQTIIKKWITKHLLGAEEPRVQGKALAGNLKDYWRYRIGDYRLLAEIKDNELIIIAVSIDHRSKVYRNK